MLKHELPMLSVKNGVSYAYDDISGAASPEDMVREARKLEIEFVRNMGVSSWVPKSQAIGKKIIKLRWVDVNQMEGPESWEKEFNNGWTRTCLHPLRLLRLSDTCCPRPRLTVKVSSASC